MAYQLKSDNTSPDNDHGVRNFWKGEGSSWWHNLFFINLEKRRSQSKIYSNGHMRHIILSLTLLFHYTTIHTSIPGKGVTSEPVAIRIFFVLTFSEEPSSLSTVTSLGPVIFPCPSSRVTLFCLNKWAIPPVKAFTAPSLAPIMALRSSPTLSTVGSNYKKNRSNESWVLTTYFHAWNKIQLFQITYNSSTFEIMLSHMIVMGIIKKGLWRNTSDVETCATKGSSLFYAYSLEKRFYRSKLLFNSCQAYVRLIKSL